MTRARRPPAGRPGHRDADAAEAHHEHGRASSTLAVLSTASHAGLDRAADHGGHVEGHVRIELDRAGLGGDDVVAEAPHADPAVDGGPCSRERRGAVREDAGQADHRRLADGHLTPHTPVAVAAGRQGRQQHLVALREARDTHPDVGDHAGRLVAEHDRHDRTRHDHGEVAVAQAAVGDLHRDTWPGPGAAMSTSSTTTSGCPPSSSSAARMTCPPVVGAANVPRPRR